MVMIKPFKAHLSVIVTISELVSYNLTSDSSSAVKQLCASAPGGKEFYAVLFANVAPVSRIAHNKSLILSVEWMNSTSITY